LDDAVEGGAVDDEVFDERKGLCAPGLEGERVAVLEMPQVELAGGGAVVAAVRDAIDDDRAHAADALPAIGVKGDWLLAAGDEVLVDHVEHLQEGHVGGEIAGRVGLEPARGGGVFLPPDFEGQVHA